MISLSTHTLDSSTGSHAKGIPVTLSVLINNSERVELWSNITDEGGRLTVEFDIEPQYLDCDLQLSFDISEYFLKKTKGVQTKLISLNIRLPDLDSKYHLPIIIAPHGASLWWSN